jgi:hypothetical protein
MEFEVLEGILREIGLCPGGLNMSFAFALQVMDIDEAAFAIGEIKIVQALPLRWLGVWVASRWILCAGTRWDGLRYPFLITETLLTNSIACNLHGTGNLDLGLLFLQWRSHQWGN